MSLRALGIGCFFCFWLAVQTLLASSIPPAPTRYVEDHAALLSPGDAERLNQRLDRYERETSNQLVVAIYPRLPAGAELAQFSTETFEAWGVGQKREDNGVVLFIFPQDRKMFIATGRGLEGALPDATCKKIITEEMTPRFRQGDFSGGITAAVDAIMEANRGEYKGTGTTQADTNFQDSSDSPIQGWIFILVMIALFFLFKGKGASRPVIYTRRGSGSWTSGSGWGGWGGGGGGGSGGFSGGGGSTSGGGAGGSW